MWLATIRRWTPIHFWLVERWQRDPGVKTAPHGLPPSTMIHSMVALPLTISRQGWVPQYSFDSGMAYVTYSEGFRSGGFNGRASAPGQYGPLRSRISEELGSGRKFTMFDNRFQLNLAAFTVKYDDKQEDIVKPGEDGQATLTVVQNASSATMEGLEMDFTWVITEGLSLRGNVGLLDASYDDFLTSSATGTVDLSASLSLRRAPDMTAGSGNGI